MNYLEQKRSFLQKETRSESLLPLSLEHLRPGVDVEQLLFGGNVKEVGDAHADVPAQLAEAGLVVQQSGRVRVQRPWEAAGGQHVQHQSIVHLKQKANCHQIAWSGRYEVVAGWTLCR
jgi:hypothetical protein